MVPAPFAAPVHRRRAKAIPSRKAASREPSGASRAMLLRMLRGIPGFRPAWIAPDTLSAAPRKVSATSELAVASDGGKGGIELASVIEESSFYPIAKGVPSFLQRSGRQDPADKCT